MRISFVVAVADLSGGARVIHTYADMLSKRGHDVQVIARPHAPRSIRNRLKAGLGMLGGDGTSQPRATHYDGSAYHFKVINEFRPIRSEDVPDSDIVIATWWETAEWIWKMPRSKGRKVHFVQGYEVFPYTDEQSVHATLRLPLPKIAVSNWLKNFLEENFKAGDVALVPNSADTELFHAPPRTKNQKPTVGLIYCPMPSKNCLAGMTAFSRVQDEIPNARLVVIGPEIAKGQLKLTPNARIFPELIQGEMPEVYGSCDVWLWPSRSEGFGLPILEAMACRTPVVATRAGAAPDIIINGENGYLVDGYGPAEMAEGLLQVVGKNDADWRRMSDRAFETAHAYSWDDATDLFERALILAIETEQADSSAGQH